MPTPRKPVQLMKKHMDKETKEYRAEAEESLLSGECWREYPEVKNNATAHRFFKRLTDLYSRIDKNDAMTEPIINRYCIIQAECYDFEKKREMFQGNIESLIDNNELEAQSKFKLEADMQKSIIGVDNALMAKRRMLLEIERETLMTLKAQLASIPKPEKEEPKKNKFTVIGNG
jgi:hypothetical protein